MQTLASATTSRKPFSRTSKQIRALSQKGRNVCEAQLGGVRTDKTWSRCKTVFERSNLDLLNAVIFQHMRRGARMTPIDRATLAELEERAWGYDEAEASHLRAVPSWLADQLPARRGAGFQDFIGLVLSAYRSGAIGVWMSYAECMAITRVRSEATWHRWTQEMEDLGLVRIQQTWVPDDSDSGRPRVFGRLLYRIGPAIEAWGEGAELERAVSERSPRAKVSRLAGITARKKQRLRCADRLAALYQRRAKCSHTEYTPRGRKAPFSCPINDNTTQRDQTTHDVGARETMSAGGSRSGATTPLRVFNNCNALPPPSSGGNTHAPADGSGLKKAQPTPQAAPVAISHDGSALPAAPFDAAQAVVQMLARHGYRPKELARQFKITPPTASLPTSAEQPPVGRMPESADAKSAKPSTVDEALRAENLEKAQDELEKRHEGRQNARELGLSGPMADQLADFFSFFRTQGTKSRF